MTDTPYPSLPTDPQARLQILLGQFEAGNFPEALHLAGLMGDAGQIHPLQTMILATSAELLQAPDRFNQAIACIDRLISNDPNSAKTMHEFERLLVAGELRKWFQNCEYARVLSHLRLARRLDPHLAQIFPADPARLLAQDALIECPDQTPRHDITGLDPFYTPGQVKHKSIPPRRVLFFARRYYYGPSSREHDMGPRVASAFEASGWSCRLIDPNFHGKQERRPTPDLLAALVQESASEIVVIDHFGIPMTVGAWADFTQRIRRDNPAIKLIHLNFDPWVASQWPALKAIADQVDLIWSATPAGPFWDSLRLRDKLSIAPFPVGVPVETLTPAGREHFVAFFGAVESYNLSRAYWLSLFHHSGLKIAGRVTHHESDGRDVMDSFTHYLNGFRSARCLLSFSMRADGTRMLTGRSFETIFSGGCLIQERVDDLDYYFEPGRHYFRFESFADLRNLLTWLSHHPEEAQATAERGQAFYHAHYSDQAIVDSLGRRLFPND